MKRTTGGVGRLLKAYDAGIEKVIALVLAPHPSLFPIHTPFPIPHSNAQESKDRAELRSLWDKFATNINQVSKKGFDRL